jgi:hypothetical protein
MSSKRKASAFWSGRTSAYEHKHNFPAKLDPKTPEGFRKVWLLDAQWSTCPVEVEQQVKDLWRLFECGNDKYIIKTCLEDLENEYQDSEVERFNEKTSKWEKGPLKTDLIVKYIREVEPAINKKDLILIHWWW